MAKLSGLFGPRKKKKKQSALQERNIVIYQITESPCSINGNQEFSFQNTDYDANQRSENYQRSSFAVPNVPASPKDNLYNNNSEDRMTHILGNTDRLSFPGNVEQTGKRKFTVLVPLSETEGPGSNKKRMPHILESIEGVEVQPRKLSRIGGSPETVRSLLGNPNEINQTRQSAICPTRRMSQPRVERLSTVHPTEINIQSERFSRVEPPSRTAEPFINSIQFIEGFGPKVQTRKLSQIEESPETVRLKSLNLKDVGPSRPSTQYPVMGMSQDQPRVVRLSTVQPMNAGINTQSGRLSKVKLLTGTEEFPLNTTQQPVVYTVRRSVSKPANRHSFSLKKLFSRKRKEEEDDKGSADSLMEQTVYAVPTVPTRGRTRSILQQSVKTLTSQKEEAPVAWKNIRYSVDTDVFSADVKRKNEKPLSPGYVNMERGQGMLVSELLNPITSIFVSDLKDPVPKDPLTKPREFNNWVRPRQGSMRQVVTPQQPVRVKVAVAPAQTNASKIQSRSKYRQKYSDSEDEESSDSYSENESMEFYNPRSKYSKPRRQYHRVYAATMPGVVLPEMRTGMKVSFLDTKPSTSISKTLILSDVKPEMEEKKNSDVVTTLASPSPSKDSLNSSGEEIRVSKLVQPPNVKRLSLAEQFDIEDAVDFLCRPPDGLNDTTSTLGSGSKLLLQMMMEKEE